MGAISMLKKLTLSLAALVACVGIAYAGGAFQGWPAVGGDGVTNCLSFGNAGVCNQFQPAGPTSVTGTETIPADTNVQGAGSGVNPATVNIPLAALGLGSYVYNAPLTGASITLTNFNRNLIVEPAGTIANLTVVFPAAGAAGSAAQLVDGQAIGICSTQIVTALAITPGAGTTVSNTVTALAVPNLVGQASCPEWIYRKANTTWYRTH